MKIGTGGKRRRKMRNAKKNKKMEDKEVADETNPMKEKKIRNKLWEYLRFSGT